MPRYKYILLDADETLFDFTRSELEALKKVLTDRGYLTAEQVEAAATSMKADNETTLDVLVSGGTIGEDEVLGTVADQFGLKYCHVNADAINPEVVKAIPAQAVSTLACRMI